MYLLGVSGRCLAQMKDSLFQKLSMRLSCSSAVVQATLERVGSRGNTGDLDEQPFYKFIQRTYAWHVVAMFAVLFAFGGLPAVIWGGAMRAVWVYHITWFVNSASHCWGYQVRLHCEISTECTIHMMYLCSTSCLSMLTIWQASASCCTVWLA